MSDTRGQRPIVPPVSAIPVDRAMEAREQVVRDAEPYMPPGQLPLERKSTEWTSRWGRFMLRGVADNNNVGKHLRDGYTPVPFEHRDQYLVNPDSVLPNASGHVQVGDLMMFRRSAIKSTQRKKYYADKTADQIRGAKNQVKKVEETRYGVLTDESSTSFEAKRSRTAEFAD